MGISTVVSCHLDSNVIVIVVRCVNDRTHPIQKKPLRVHNAQCRERTRGILIVRFVGTRENNQYGCFSARPSDNRRHLHIFRPVMSLTRVRSIDLRARTTRILAQASVRKPKAIGMSQ